MIALFRRFSAVLAMMVVMVSTLFGQATTYDFVQRDTCTLKLDVYRPTVENNRCCVLFVFGGGFVFGQRDHKDYVKFAQKLNERGYTFVSIDYRLGLRGANMKGAHVIHSLEYAIRIAVEDLFSATEYLLQHADELGFDRDKIVLCGSSAGAITVLQADYELCNRREIAAALPSDFHYAGVMSFSGAIFSRNGAVKYAEPPAPTLFFHGIEDHLVTYKSIRFANYGFFGTKPLVKRFAKFHYPYIVRRYKGLGHEVAATMNHEVRTCDEFMRRCVLKKEWLQMDATLDDPAIKPAVWGKVRPGDVY